MSVAAVSFAGDIQVFCSPGLRIYLDGEFMGTSSVKEDGHFLMNVTKRRAQNSDREGWIRAAEHPGRGFEVPDRGHGGRALPRAGGSLQEGSRGRNGQTARREPRRHVSPSELRRRDLWQV